jgi:hypothetical protein
VRGPRRPRVPPPARASERPTLKTLPPVFTPPSSGSGNTEVIELSASALDSDVSLIDLEERGRRSPVPTHAHAPALPRARRRRMALLAATVALAVGLAPSVASSVGERATGVSAELRRPAREAHEVGPQHTPLGARTAAREASAPPGACAAVGSSRVLSTRAYLPPGLDVGATDSGFGVAFATGAEEALGLGLRVSRDGSALRVGERVRVRGRPGGRIGHVAVVDADDAEELDLRIDADDSRTVRPVASGGSAGSFRMSVNGGWIQLIAPGPAGTRTLWPVPGSGSGSGRKAAAGKGAAGKAPPSGELRVAAREEGGAIVALRVPSALWLGLVDAELRAEGPLVPLTRAGAVLGTPAVTPALASAGGAVAWAERPAGAREWIVMVATFARKGGAPGPVLRPIAAGMSPSLAALPGGDLLLAYAVGGPGAHQVVVRRLSQELELRGDALVVSPEAINSGQPTAAVAADGRALVAFFGAERGRPASVLATPLACSLGP